MLDTSATITGACCGGARFSRMRLPHGRPVCDVLRARCRVETGDDADMRCDESIVERRLNARLVASKCSERRRDERRQARTRTDERKVNERDTILRCRPRRTRAFTLVVRWAAYYCFERAPRARSHTT